MSKKVSQVRVDKSGYLENFCQAQAAVNVDAHSSRFAREAQAAVNFDAHISRFAGEAQAAVNFDDYSR